MQCTPDAGGGRIWNVAATACEAAPPCGGEPSSPACPDGQLCVISETVVGPMSEFSYRCADNPCTPQTTSCACATSLCEGLFCVDANPRVLSCTNGAQ
jgi:hypothetical protein